jgi:hypothetical protein
MKYAFITMKEGDGMIRAKPLSLSNAGSLFYNKNTKPLFN